MEYFQKGIVLLTSKPRKALYALDGLRLNQLYKTSRISDDAIYNIYVHCPRSIVDTKVSIPINVISSLYFVIAFSWPFWIPRSLILWNYIWAAQSCVSQSMMMDHNSAIVYVCQTVCFFHETLVGIWPRPAPRIVGEIQHLLRTYIVWRITYIRHILRILQAPTLMDKYSCWTATRGCGDLSKISFFARILI